MSLTCEEVLSEINFTLWCMREISEVKRRDTKHLSTTLTITRCDDGGVDPVEATLMVEAVGRLCQTVANPGHGADEVGAGPKMGKAAEVLEAMAFGLERIVLGIVDPAYDPDLEGVDFDTLSASLGFLEQTPNLDRATGRQTGDVLGVVVEGVGCDDLQGCETASVVELDEG